MGLDNVDVDAATATAGVLPDWSTLLTSNIHSAPPGMALLLSAARQIPRRRFDPARAHLEALVVSAAAKICSRDRLAVGLGRIGRLVA